MDPELETLEASFNTRIEKWISKQGLFFQFTHDTGSGSMFPKICGLLFRLLILALIGLVVFWFYLTSMPNSAAFKLDVEQQIAKGLNAGEVEISRVSRAMSGFLTGEMKLSTVSLGETPTSFFEDWHVMEEDVSVVGRRSIIDQKKTATFEGVSLSPLGIGDNYFSGWSLKEMKILKMELKLKTGDTTDEEAMASYSSLFKEYESLNIDTIQVFDATLLWGYSETTAGAIRGAQLDITKGLDSWEIIITGGTFSHNWLQDATINKMKVICMPTGEVKIESASLRLGEGILNFDASIQVKAEPELKGSYSFENVEVTDLIGDSYEDWLDGNLEGAGLIEGKMNSAEGIKITTKIELSGSAKSLVTSDASFESKNGENDNVLIIRGDNLPLLKLMQMKDPRNSYSLIRAYKGTLIIENQDTDTEVTINDLRCGDNDLILMKGKFDYALRTARAEDKEQDVSSLELNDTGEGEDAENTLDEFEAINTVRAFSGKLELGLIPEVFENNIKVLDVYPVDNSTLRVWFNIDLQGQLEELTEELADELYEIMKDDENN